MTDVLGANDDHVSMYAWDWLLRHRKSASFAVKTDEKKNSGDKLAIHSRSGWGVWLTSRRTRLWGSTVGQEPPSVRYEEVMADDQGVGKWTAKIVGSVSTQQPRTVLTRTARVRLLLRGWVPSDPRSHQRASGADCFHPSNALRYVQTRVRTPSHAHFSRRVL